MGPVQHTSQNRGSRDVQASLQPRPWAGLPGSYYLTWVGVCAAAELLGIALGTGWWVAMDRIAPDPASLAGKFAMLGLKSLSGLVEGVVLGLLQGLVLRRLYPRLPLPAWIALTALLAIGGWAAGSAIPIFGGPGGEEPAEPSLFLSIVLAAGFGLAAGALFGAVQAAALRRAASASYWWIIVNAAGWALALPVIYAAASLPDAASPIWLILAAGLASGATAGIVLGAVTGLAFWRMPAK